MLCFDLTAARLDLESKGSPSVVELVDALHRRHIHARAIVHVDARLGAHCTTRRHHANSFDFVVLPSGAIDHTASTIRRDLSSTCLDETCNGNDVRMEHDDEQQRDDLDESDDAQDDPETPHRTFRQLLHWATGDRDAEAVALADVSPEEVTVEDAAVAVAQAHGEAPSDRDINSSDVASVEDAIAVHEEKLKSRVSEHE